MPVGVVEVPPADALLADGRVVEIRQLVPDDLAELEALYGRLSKEAMRMRFFSYSQQVGQQDIKRMMRRTGRDQLSLVAVDGSRIIGVATLARSGAADRAEFALIVDDERHGQGIGTLLIEHVIAAARRLGYARLHADVLSDNAEMLHVLRDLGAAPKMRASSGVVDVDFVLPAHGEWHLAVQERESIAEYASLEHLLSPKSIAVVGAGQRPSSVGRRIVGNLVAAGFTGRLYAVNPGGLAVDSVPGYADLSELPESPDLVVVAVPALGVLEVIGAAAAIGARGAVIVSDGFAELGDTGRDLQRDILATARRGGMRLIGPNCLGIANFDGGVRMNATFADMACPAGSLGVATQSGGVGLALLDAMARRGIGLSTFVSMGNKADVSGNDMLLYWSQDPATSVCLLYLESFGNARKFAQIARQVARTKPIVAITAGRSVAGARGVRSHTAAAATPDVALDALFHQAGVIRAASLSEALDVISILGTGSIPSGGRVGVVSNGGGPAALTADACSAVGLDLPELSRGLRDRLATVLPAHAATSNPVDTTAGGGPAELAECARMMADSGEVDSVIVIHASLASTDRDAVAAALAEIHASCPVLAVFLGSPTSPDALRQQAGEGGVPCFAYPEEAARALASVTDYAAWRRLPHPPQRPVSAPSAKARRMVRDFLADHPEGGWLDTHVAAGLLEASRIPVVRTVPVGSVAEAVTVAAKLGYPVVVKAAAGTILHRTELGGVFVGVRSVIGVRRAFKSIRAQWGPDCPVVIQPMASRGVETAVGMIQDPSVGPVVMAAMGGIATDLLADRSFRLPPLSLADAKAQIAALRGSPLLSGYRGAEVCDTKALAEILRRVGDLALGLPELAELDLNPVVVSPEGALALDVKIRLAPSAPFDPYVRSLKTRPPLPR
ncbi:MAG TPA: GNAT family N-acetyltransferase [Mycobacteriales bacterium]|nr:GNAT family N-acetyltransferase [Mycobacteriales bacterium]